MKPYYEDTASGIVIYHGRAEDVLLTLPSESVHCCVTSPPYWGLRDYGVAGQLGLEPTPEEYVGKMVAVFREVRRVLRDDGTCWVNLGDSYASAWACNRRSIVGQRAPEYETRLNKLSEGIKEKDLVGIPWAVAFALRADGWYLRSDIIWCLSGGAWLYAKTQKGEMPVMVKDLVRLDAATVKLWNGERWTQVLGWNESINATFRVELVLRSGERIGCTSSHRWPTNRGVVRTSELRVGDVISSCVIPEPTEATKPAYLTHDAAWFVGLYLAEGSMCDDTIQISGNADEAGWIERIDQIARHYGGSSTFTIDGNNLSIRVYCRVLRAILENYVGGTGAIDKHFKVAAWSLPNEILRMMLCGYFEGDGHDDCDNERIRLGFCRNYSLERDLRTAAARLSATLTLNPMTATNQDGQYPAFRGEWRWERSGHWNEKDRGEVIEIRQSRARQFWDIGVEDEPHLFALASGILTHNSKPNPMPESVTDRPTKAHEYIFMLSKSERYWYDAEAISEPLDGQPHAPGNLKLDSSRNDHDSMTKVWGASGKRNKRSVWTVATVPYPGSHFATFPPKLIEPCIKAGCPAGGTVLDPFHGSGTTGYVAQHLGCRYVGIELNAKYIDLSKRRVSQRVLFGAA